MEYRKILRERIETSVIAERALAPSLSRLDVAFEHDVCTGRDFEVDGHGLYELDPSMPEETGQQQLVQTFGHGCGGRISECRVRAQGYGHLQPLAEPLGDAMVLGPALVSLPVHAGGAAVEDLHAVGSHVPHAGLRVLRDYQRERDVASAVFRPGF
jgi:hypothetical protein